MTEQGEPAGPAERSGAQTEVPPGGGTDSARGPRRSRRRWLGRAALAAVTLVLVLTVAGLVVYDYGTMWPPTAETEAEYQALVAAGKAPPEPPAPGLRIPIPGCVCHANDADLAVKAPGHAPDPILVITHRYRTFGECAGCHGGKSEASEGIAPGEPGNQPVVPAQ
jgi:hypothetical protein